MAKEGETDDTPGADNLNCAWMRMVIHSFIVESAKRGVSPDHLGNHLAEGIGYLYAAFSKPTQKAIDEERTMDVLFDELRKRMGDTYQDLDARRDEVKLSMFKHVETDGHTH